MQPSIPFPVPPGLAIVALLILVTAQLLYVGWPHQERRFAAILLLTALGFTLGAVWDQVGLPAFRVGEATLLPGLPFALALQPLARFLPSPSR